MRSLLSAGVIAWSFGEAAAAARFPIGVFGVTRPEHLRQLEADGFDSFQTYLSDPKALGELADEARKRGLGMVAYPDQLRLSDARVTAAWPVDAWYLVDEPDVIKMSSAALANIAERTRAWDPKRPRVFVIGQGSAAAEFAGVGDILMLDWYPIPHRPADSVAQEIDKAFTHLPQDKPLWMVVQAYDWADEVKDPVKRRGLRFPDHREIRFMSYIAVMHGARGLYYFTLAKKDKTLLDYPELWQAVTRVVREIGQVRPFFEKGRFGPLPFLPNPDGPEARSWRYDGRELVVLANRKPGAYLRVPSELLARPWRPRFEPRREAKDSLKEIDGAWYLKPLQIMVFERRI